MTFPQIRFSLIQFLLLIALVTILVSAAILLWQPSGVPEYWASAVAFSPDGKTLAASLYVFHNVQIWNPTPRVLGADASQSFFLCDVPDLNEKKLLDRAQRPGVLGVAWPVRKMGLGQSLAFSPDGKMLATQGLNNTVSLWNISSCKMICELSVADQLSGAVSWAADGTLVASATNACYILRANAPALQKRAPPVNVSSVKLSSDGGKLLTADDDGKVELWDARSAIRLHELVATGDPFRRLSLAISPDGQLIAAEILNTGSSQTSVRIWDAASGQERHTWDIPSPIFAVSFSPDNTILAVAGGGKKLRFYSLNGRANEAIDTDDGMISTIAYSPDGRFLATGGRDGQLSLWDLSTKKLLKKIQLHTAPAISDWAGLAIASILWIVAWRYIRRWQKLRFQACRSRQQAI